MLERCEEKSAEMLLDELLGKGIIVEGCLLWRAGSVQARSGSEGSSQEIEHRVDD
jgi:hypothetical protein